MNPVALLNRSVIVENRTGGDGLIGIKAVKTAAPDGTTVLITKHDSPRAVLISIDHFQSLQEAPQAKLNTLTEQFDTLLERMQSPKARRGMAAAFRANTKQLGKAAVAAARKRAMTSSSKAADKKLRKSVAATARKRA